MLAPLLITSVGAAVLLLEIFGWYPRSETVSKALAEGLGGHPVSAFLVVVIVGPCAEEFFFRGWMLRNFLRRYSVGKSVLASALFFSAFHIDPR